MKLSKTHLKAVAPYRHKNSINFKTAPYEAWVKIGGLEATPHYPWRMLHGLAYRFELPTLLKRRNEARLRFVEPVSVSFDTFPDYARYEIVPIVWDCWPDMFEKMCTWLKKHNVRSAIFTASQTAALMQERFPEMNILCITEGIDTSLYSKGLQLSEREIDLLEFGRSNERVFKSSLPATVNHICTKQGNKFIFTNEQLFAAMANARITICLPRCDTQPEKAGNIETLTQRYWEAMLSRMIIVGRAPRELTDLLGYNPVVTLDAQDPNTQIQGILAHIEDYQPLVDKNRETALIQASWTLRMKQIKEWLTSLGYN